MKQLRTLSFMQPCNCLLKVLFLSVLFWSTAGLAYGDGDIQFLVISGDLTEQQKQAVKVMLVKAGDSLADIVKVKRDLENSDWCFH